MFVMIGFLLDTTRGLTMSGRKHVGRACSVLDALGGSMTNALRLVKQLGS
jgi:hypothetical protein